MKIANIYIELIDRMGTDLNVVNAARVSFDNESDFAYDDEAEKFSLSIKDAKLISYLARHKHTSPFNHAFASFRVKAPIFVARQLVKHKFLPWNEVSRRYVDSDPEFFMPEYWRKKADNVKQGSSLDAVHEVDECVTVQTERAFLTYKNLLSQGVCPEQARMVLPQNTITEWIWSGSLGAWGDMCRLRLDSHTQYETRFVAQEISKVMEELYPVSWEALIGEVKNG